MARVEVDGNEAHRKAEWLAYHKHLAEVEELRALEQAYKQAAHEVLVLRAELLDAQLDRERAELAWRLLGLARGVELLDAFRGALRTIIHDAADPLQIIKQIKEKLKVSPCEAIDWTKLDVEFRQTYPEFQPRLISRYPELTEMEMKICALLRLKLTSADIGKLLCISQGSVKRHCLWIGKKMGLTRGEDVYNVLTGI